MSFSQLPQKPATWYAVEPLRGSGKNGTLRDEDFLSALYISRDTFHAIKDTCAQVLDKQAEDPGSKIDLRSLWRRRDGHRIKITMLEDVIRAHPETFDDTGRLQHVPDNWNTVSQALVELCIVSANAARSRRLQRGNTRSRANSPSRTDTPSATESALFSDWTTISLPQALSMCFLLTQHIMLNNIVVPVVYGDHRVDILPRRFQKSNPRPGEPQRLEDVSLDRLLGIVAQEFEMHDVLQIWGKNSSGSLIRLENDDHLTVALFFLLPFIWQPGHQQSPGLEVR